MYKFVQRVNEIRNVFTQSRIIELALDSIILFLTAFLIFPYLGIRPGWMMLVPSLLYAIIKLKYRTDNNIVERIEEHYPSLRERLSTVYDNREEKNVVVEHLATSVLEDMEQVRYSSFISTRRIGIRTAVILLLVTFVLSTAFFIPSANERFGSSPPEAPSGAGLDKNAGSPDTDIFNESSYVRIGNDSQPLLIYRGQASELNLPGEVKPAAYSHLFPVEEPLAADPSGMYAEPLIHQQIVRNYFTNLSGQE